MRTLRIGVMAALICLFVAPFSASAAVIAVVQQSGTIDAASLLSEESKPTITGTALSSKKAQLIVRREGEDKTLYKRSSIKVKDDAWTAKISKKLPDGRYSVELRATDSRGRNYETVATGTLKVGKDAANAKIQTTLVVSTIPLLRGGPVRASASAPVAYLQITNTGALPATLRGFLLKQNGTASGSAVIGLTSIDDKGGSKGATAALEGASPFAAGIAYAPTDATLMPGEMKLFTVRAVITKNVAPYIGKTLAIDLTGLDTNAATVQGSFPLRGTTLTLSY
ncbi:MAG TPA: Ig-like domain-containing protein [Candidatus Paceibacterota bacterium]|nr:Ig-like domain-containing protein [Candidatus Paceibacterota bacterium]